MARTGKRVPAAARRDKIVEVTLRLVADEGIEGATTARIAAAAGVSEGTLYRLFGNKRGILLAAIDAVHRHFFELMEASRREDPVASMSELGRLHTESMVGSGIDHFIAPLFAFMTAPAHMGLREAVAKYQQQIIDKYTEILEEGKASGQIPEGADLRQAAWSLAAIFWAEDLSSIMGLPGFVLEGRARKAREATLRCFARCAGCPETTSDLVSTVPARGRDHRLNSFQNEAPPPGTRWACAGEGRRDSSAICGTEDAHRAAQRALGGRGFIPQRVVRDRSLYAGGRPFSSSRDLKASTRRSYDRASDWGITRTSASTGMKLVSPCQRGTRCKWR